MEKDNVFTYEPKMKANLELIMDIIHCDCQEIVYMDEKIKVLEKALELACEECLSFPCSEYCGTKDKCETCCYKAEYTPEKFKTKAKEMMESE